MDMAFLLIAHTPRAATGRAWLKSAEFGALQDARGLIDAANAEAQQLLEAAQRRVPEIERAARDQGHAKGMAEAAAELAKQALGAALVLRQLEGVIAKAVSTVLADTVKELPEAALYAAALRKAASVVRGEPFLRLRVPPGREVAAREALTQVLRQGMLEGSVELVVDSGLADLACVMESEAGSVSAGLDVQIAAVGQAVTAELERLFAPHGQGHEP